MKDLNKEQFRVMFYQRERDMLIQSVSLMNIAMILLLDVSISIVVLLLILLALKPIGILLILIIMGAAVISIYKITEKTKRINHDIKIYNHRIHSSASKLLGKEFEVID